MEQIYAWECEGTDLTTLKSELGITEKTVGGTSYPYIIDSVARPGAKALLTNMSTPLRFSFGSPVTQYLAEGTIGFRVRFTALGTITAAVQVGEFQCAGLGHFQVYYDTDGTFFFRNTQSTAVIGAASSGKCPLGEGHYVAFSWKIHDSAGVIRMAIDGAVADATAGTAAGDTHSASPPSDDVNSFVWGTSSSSSNAANLNVEILDVYVNDTKDTYCGDVQVLVDYPTADGAYAELTASPAGDHYANVDDAVPDGTTTVNYGTTGVDSYAFAAPAYAPLAVHGAHHVYHARKDSAADRYLADRTRVGATDYDASPQALAQTGAGTDNMTTHLFARTKHPGGDAWTQANLALQLGPKVT